MEPYTLTISQALESMKAGELSSQELTQSCLDRINTVEEDLQAFVSYDAERAISSARESS